MKFSISVSGLIFGLVCSMYAASPMLVRQSYPIWDASSIQGEFQSSYQNRSFPKPDYRISLISIAPSIGHYQNAGTGKSGATSGEFYNFRKRLALIELSSSVLNLLPPSVTQSIANKQLKQPVQINIMISGGVQITAEDSRNKTYNMMFHGWLSALHGNQKVNTNPLLGIFLPNGVKGVSIAVNSLKPCNVNVHDSDISTYALSPDNVRVGIEKGREISTFWSVGYAPTKSAAVITFHILVNSTRLEEEVGAVCQVAYSVRDLLDGLGQIRKKVSGADQQALSTAVATILGLI